MDEIQPNRMCVLVDVENVTKDVYRLHDSHTELKTLRLMLEAIDAYLKKYGMVAPEEYRKVFLVHTPPRCVLNLFQEFHYTVVLSRYRGENAADNELLDHFEEILQEADPLQLLAFLVVSNDQIFRAVSSALVQSPFASVCAGRHQPTRFLSEEFDEVLRFWRDCLGGRLVRISARSLEVPPELILL